jgi:hypothetical protein
MRNINKSATKPLSQPSQVAMKNKARLSIMTAFSFGYHLKHLKIDQLYPFKKGTIRVFFLRFTSQNETSKSPLIPTFKTPLISMQWHPLAKGGIVLFRLLVAV